MSKDLKECKKLLEQFFSTNYINLSSKNINSPINSDIEKFLLKDNKKYLSDNIAERALIDFVQEKKVFKNSKGKFRLDFDYSLYHGENRLFKAYRIK